CPLFTVRPFARHDRDRLASLVNRHVAAVLPGGAIPTATLLSQMERDTTEPIIDPWVIDRHTLVGIAADRVVAAAHLKRYGHEAHVAEGFRDLGMIDWIVCEPAHLDVGAALLEAAHEQFRQWDSREWSADGTLPCL